MKWVLGKIFSMKNITVPLRLLASLLFGYKYMTKEERLHKKLLSEAWGVYASSSENRLWGMSKMLIKSLILAVIGAIAMAGVILFRKKK
jgi:hypothetical protein